MAVAGLTLTLGGSALLVPTMSAAQTDNGAPSGAALFKAQDDNLIAIAQKHRLGLGEVLGAERAMQNAGLGATSARAQDLVTTEKQHRETTGSSLELSVRAETHQLIAIAQKRHLGVGEVLGAERALQNGGLGLGAGSASNPSAPQ
jgi:hypothetical protein